MPGADVSERRHLVRRGVLVGAVLVAGIVVVLLTSGVARIIGWTVFSIGIVLLLSAIFYEVGRSEDRAREREQAARRRRTPPA